MYKLMMFVSSLVRYKLIMFVSSVVTLIVETSADQSISLTSDRLNLA
jgi:hypothetical protein